MLKILKAYQANPTLKNAQKVRTYHREHPMSCAMLYREESDLLATAIHHANLGKKPD